MIRVTDSRVEKWVNDAFPCINAVMCGNWGEGNPKHIKGCPAKVRYRAITLAYKILRAVQPKSVEAS